MPITKIPVVHKFGIISSTQRLELQERLLKQTYLSTIKSRKGGTASQRNPIEVTEEFIQQFNSAEEYDVKEKLEEKARKLLERSKRRCGVKNCGHGSHVNLPLAWTEMAQLAQCKGVIQEECLDALITSLEVSPLEKYHIPALFFLAETMLYWLRTEAVLQPFLRTAELKLLKMGQLVFERLFFHHMAGQLQGHTDSKNRLFTYIDGLQACQEAYNPYPDALLALRLVLEVGKIVLADSQLEPGDIKEGDRLPGPRSTLDQVSMATRDMFDRQSNHSAAISSSVHDLSPTLWHALDVWRCTNCLGGGLREALKALAHCGLGLATETWVDGMVAIQILGETGKTSLAATKVLHRLAQGSNTTEDLVSPPLSSGRSDVFSISSDGEEAVEGEARDMIAAAYGDIDDDVDIDNDDEGGIGGVGADGTLVTSQASLYSSKASLSDIYERSEEGEAGERPRNATAATTDSSEISSNISSKKSPKQAEETQVSMPSAAVAERSMNREVSFDEAALLKSSPPQRGDTRARGSGSNIAGYLSQQDSKLSSRSLDPGRGTGWRPEVGSEIPGGRGSQTSSVQTFTNMPKSDTPGLLGWHWEVALTYSEALADIVLFGSTAAIQKFALVGAGGGAKQGGQGFSTLSQAGGQLGSAGLLDLAFFSVPHEASDGGPNDWSWRIRYGALRALVRICRCLEGDKSREGLRTAAWNTLLRANSWERDGRVLEALKVGQVHSDLTRLLDPAHHSRPAALGGRVAHGLSIIYLPPIPPPSTTSVARKVEPKTRPRPTFRPAAPAKAVGHPVRTSLRQELDLATALYEQAPDYNTRKAFDLHRIVEDQWRKELQAQLENNEEEELDDLKAQQKQDEQQQRQRETIKVGKFKASKRLTGNSALKVETGSAALHRNEPHIMGEAQS